MFKGLHQARYGAAVIIFATLAAVSWASENARPNILLIMSDDVGFSDIGAFGGEIHTPHIDRLASGGKIFTQFYNTARCCPSRASLLTGLYAHQAGVGHLIFNTPHIGYGDHLTSDSITVAEVLQRSGYATYMAGKWHLAPRTYDPKRDARHWPTRRGFGRFYGTINGSGSFFDPSTLTRDDKYISPDADPVYQPKEFYYTDAISDNAIKFLQEHEAVTEDKPFFMYVAYTAPHWPLHAPEDAIAPYRGKYDGGYKEIHAARRERISTLDLLPEVGEPAPLVGDWDAIKDKKTEAALMETYAGMITRMDQGIGKILAELEKTGKLDNTLVIYLQDNGACAEDPFGKPRPQREPIGAMEPGQIQTSAQPEYTRDGRPVRMGHDVMPGPADTFTAYKENWANVSNTPFRLYKHFMHEGGISTPMIAHWPAAIKATSETRVIRTPAHLVDIMPTLLEVAGAKYPSKRRDQKLQPLAGISLASALTSGTAIHRGKPLFWEHEGNRAVRDGKWKLVSVSEKGPWELYDMDVDRAETKNLAGENPAIVEKMSAQWDQWAAENRVLPLGGWRNRISRSETRVEGKNKVSLKQKEVLSVQDSLKLKENGIKIQAEVVEGPVEGVLAAQGASFDGFSIFAQNGKIHFAATMDKELQEITVNVPSELPFTVTATIALDGLATLQAGTNKAEAPFGGVFPRNPTQGFSAGLDSETPVVRGQGNFPFKGKLGLVTGETIVK